MSKGAIGETSIHADVIEAKQDVGTKKISLVVSEDEHRRARVRSAHQSRTLQSVLYLAFQNWLNGDDQEPPSPDLDIGERCSEDEKAILVGVLRLLRSKNEGATRFVKLLEYFVKNG